MRRSSATRRLRFLAAAYSGVGSLIRNCSVTPSPTWFFCRYVCSSFLENAIYAYVDHNNKNPKPFVWTKKADEIIEKVERCKAILETGH